VECILKGYNGTLVLGDAGVTIKRGARGFLLGGGTVRGDKFVPYETIVAVQFKRPGLSVGYLQLSLRGGSEAKSGVMEATKDENTVTFTAAKIKEFTEARDLIMARLGAGETKVCPDCAETVKAAANVCRFCGYRFS
jgi:hypothetical protein